MTPVGPTKAAAMSIERLNRAAAAAGFAMATPDDELVAEETTAVEAEKTVSRAIVLASPVRSARPESVLNVSHWFRAHIPVWGWRAPA